MELGNQFTLKDIFAVYMQGKPQSGNVAAGKVLPLNLIDASVLASFDAQNMAQLEKAVASAIEKSREAIEVRRKVDPLEVLLGTSLLPPGSRTPEAYVEIVNQQARLRQLTNSISILTESIVTLPINIKPLSDNHAMDVAVYDVNDEPVAIADLKTRYNTMNSSAARSTQQRLNKQVTDKDSAYYGCEAILVERIPKNEGKPDHFQPDKSSESSAVRMGLQQFFERYAGDRLAYLKAILLIAKTLEKNGMLPADFDMSAIFEFYKKSISSIDRNK